MKVQHILFPTDFSERARLTEARVLKFAQHFQARVTALHVIELPASYYGMAAGHFFETPDSYGLEARARETLASVFPGNVVERSVKFGSPAGVIAEFADANGVDLIMMPTHGHGRFRRALIGSVTAKILHDVGCPVWTMAHSEEPCPDCDLEPKRIICAIDLVDESVPLLRSAADLAQAFDAQMWLAHVVPQVHSFREEYTDASNQMVIQRQNYYADHARQRIAALQSQAGTAFQLCMSAGPVAATIAEIARKHQANLVITGRGAMDGFLGAIRSHAYPIIQESPCPVISV